MSLLSHIPRSQYNIVLKDRVMFHIINDDFIQGHIFGCPKPKHISFRVPKLTKPAFPAVTQSSLASMQPGIFFVEYDCDKHCRSVGICVHYQFVIGSKKCPDGLVCEICRRGAEQVAINAARKCPMHYRPSELKPIPSRPEDFCATNEQQTRCAEILQRSVENNWADVGRENKNKRRRTSLLAHEERARGRPQARLDLVDQSRRETTPRTIDDVQRTEAVRKLSEDVAFDSGYSLWHSSFSEKDPGFVDLQNSLLKQGTGIGRPNFRSGFEGWEQNERYGM